MNDSFDPRDSGTDAPSTDTPPFTQPPYGPPYDQYPYGQPPHAPYYPPVPQPKKRGGGMAIASLICGIASLVVCCAGISSLLGGLAILFALLSRKDDDRFSGIALAGLICGVIGVVLGLLILVAVLNGTMEKWLDTYVYEYEEELQHFATLLRR